MSLKPELKHNREDFDKLRRRKWQALAAAVLAMLPVVFLLPGDAIEAASIVLLAVAGATFLYFEFKMTLVFRRDLQERGDAGGRGRDGS